MLRRRRPDAERVERRNRAGEQRRGAVIGAGRRAISAVAMPASASAMAAVRPGRAAADDRNFNG